MVAAGVGEKVGLSLMVLASSRVEAQGFANVQIAEGDLTWDWTAMHSNYNDLFRQAVTSNGGRTWVIESVQNLLATQLTYQVGWGPGHPGFDAGTDAGVDVGSTMPWLDAGDAWLASDAGATQMTDAGTMSPADPFIDRTMAFEGLGHVAVVTRMRTELSAADLDTDLILQASSGTYVPAQYVVRAEYGNCPPPTYACAVLGGGTPVALEALFVVVVVLRVRAYRRRRNR
jgi:hypothetical protein